MEGMVNPTLPDRLVNHIHKTSRSISDTSFKHKDSVTIYMIMTFETESVNLRGEKK